MSRLLAIDPGPEQSAWLVLVDGAPAEFAIQPNADILGRLRLVRFDEDRVAIEQVESFGMPVGREVFETVRWAGRFEEASWPLPVTLVPRRAVKVHVCHDTRARDGNIRAALIDRFGGPAATRKGGVLHGISRDVWSALAIAVTAHEAEVLAAAAGEPETPGEAQTRSSIGDRPMRRHA